MSIFGKFIKTIEDSQPVTPVKKRSVSAAATSQTQTVQNPTDGRTVKIQSVSVEQHTVVLDAQSKAREIILEARDQVFQMKKQVENDLKDSQRKSLELQQKILKEQAEITRALAETESKNIDLDKRAQEIEDFKKKLEQDREALLKTLEKSAGMTKNEAQQKLLSSLEMELSDEIEKRIKEAEETIKERADEKAREILTDSMLHGATDYVAEYTTSVVNLPSEDIKGRIIGKEGRNIRTYETITGVDVDFDTDVPNQIRLSCFDPVRREIARVTMERLIKDQRIQPTRIEEIYEQTKSELEKIMAVEGQKLCHAVGVYNLHPDLVKMLGRFKYRFSYGQNLIVHTLEETKIGIALANEVGADVNIVKLGCLLHDVGKIVAKTDGTHVTKGVELAKKYSVPQAAIDCIAQHHEDEPFSSVESMIVYIADAISGSRPGARHEPVEEYIDRLSNIEKVADSYAEVEKSFAIQAGREVRVIVKPEKVDDKGINTLAHDIARRLETEIAMRPGQIKVTVIRETRASDQTN